jgi:hypothetical protein
MFQNTESRNISWTFSHSIWTASPRWHMDKPCFNAEPPKPTIYCTLEADAYSWDGVVDEFGQIPCMEDMYLCTGWYMFCAAHIIKYIPISGTGLKHKTFKWLYYFVGVLHTHTFVHFLTESELLPCVIVIPILLYGIVNEEIKEVTVANVTWKTQIDLHRIIICDWFIIYKFNFVFECWQM